MNLNSLEEETSNLKLWEVMSNLNSLEIASNMKLSEEMSNLNSLEEMSNLNQVMTLLKYPSIQKEIFTIIFPAIKQISIKAFMRQIHTTLLQIKNKKDSTSTNH